MPWESRWPHLRRKWQTSYADLKMIKVFTTMVTSLKVTNTITIYHYQFCEYCHGVEPQRGHTHVQFFLPGNWASRVA